MPEIGDNLKDIQFLPGSHNLMDSCVPQRLSEKNPNLGVDFYPFLRIIRDERKVEANADSI